MADYIVEGDVVSLTKREVELINLALLVYADGGFVSIDNPIFYKFNFTENKNTRGFLQGKDDDETHGTFILTTDPNN